MPIYEYKCPECGVIECMQGIKESPLSKCPRCHKRRVKKLISESSFQLKGSGWYATDYGKGNGNGKGKKGKESADKGESESPAKAAEKSGTTAKTETASTATPAAATPAAATASSS